jgi:hypothetical protein
MKSDSRSRKWIPESEFRDTLLVQKLPAALREKNFFWIDVRRYLRHDDARLPADDYLRHWQQIYECCMSEDVATLRRLVYLSFEEPRRKKKSIQ